ncbi:MAG: lysophospholipid acyltransferase family protein [Kiritimatiellae bacterium]|nr:lysophospholipid acyltransferase family protein [Kiritimatiellia bacterium]
MTFVQRHAYGFGFGLAAAFWPLFRRRRRLSVDNLLRGGVAADEAEARRIAKCAFCHFLGHVFEAMCVPGVVTRENWRDHLDFSEADPTAVKALLDDVDRPVLLVSGHHGCWEAATNIISFARPMIAVARVMDSKLLQNWIRKHHFRGPVTIVNKNDGFTKGVLEQWQRENAAMTILMDQYSYGGAKTQFFGRPTRTVTSAARLAIRYGCPVVVGSFVRVAPYRYRLVGDAPLVFARDFDRDAAVQALNDRLEAAIRRYPDQYLWMHRKWRE